MNCGGLMCNVPGCTDCFPTAVILPFPNRRQHVWLKHENCQEINCMYCDGGLAYCTVCKAGECELEKYCPGYPKIEMEQNPDPGAEWEYAYADAKIPTLIGDLHEVDDDA